jgi:hypothetical protein
VKKSRAAPNVLPAPEQEAFLPKKMRQTKTASSGAKQHGSEHSQPPLGQHPILDERITGVLFDSLASVQAAILSATGGLPYGAVRQAMAIGEQEKVELTRAAQAVAAKHPAFFLKHKQLFEFTAALTAINAAHVDHLLSFALSGDRGCSTREALFAALSILAPLVIVAIVLIVKRKE